MSMSEYSSLFKVKQAKFELYPHQKKAIEEFRKAFLGGHKKVALCLATNAGKSVISYSLVYNALKKNKKVLYLVHRKSLIEQMGETLFGLPNVVIETWQSSKNKTHENIDFIIADECHYASYSKMQLGVLEKYKGAYVCGLSATPIEADGTKLEGWDKVIDIIQLRELIEIGRGAPFRILQSKTNIDFDNLKKESKGDYNAKEVEKEVNKKSTLADVIGAFIKYGVDKETKKPLKSFFFCVTISHCEKTEEELRSKGIKAKSYHSKLPKQENDNNLKAFKDGKLDALISVESLTTGIDIPDIYCIVLCTPTKSWVKMIQIVGRIVRLDKNNPNKEGLILDCANVIKNTTHPLLDLDLNKPRVAKNKENSCSLCDGKVIVAKREIVEDNKLLQDGVLLQKTTFKCVDCGKIDTKIEKFIENVSICEQCDNPVDKKERIADFRKIEDSDVKLMEFFTICPNCDFEKVYRTIELVDEFEMETINLDDVDSWEQLRKQLKKAKNKDGKPYHHYWRVKVVEALQVNSVPLEFAKKEIEFYLKKDWVLGGIANKIIEKHRTLSQLNY